MSGTDPSAVEAESAGSGMIDPLCSALATVTALLQSASIAVTREDVVIAGIPDSLLRGVRCLSDELQKVDEARNLAGFAHALACICGGNVPNATVDLTFEGQVDDSGRGYTSRYSDIVTSETVDGKEASMAPYSFREIDDRLTCDSDLGFIEGIDTNFAISAELSMKLFTDGDYKAFLEATSPGVLYPLDAVIN